LKPPDGLGDLVEEELLEARLKYKTKMLGNIKFVGQLLINKVLSTKIIFQCAYALLDSPSDEKLETLCAFLNTIGPAYDSPEWKSYASLTQVFAEVKMLSSPSCKDHDIPPRIKFLLKDVVDLRASGWDKAMRPNSQPEGPMKISEVQQKWAKDNAAPKGGGKGVPAPLQEPVDDEWATVGKARIGFKQASSALSTQSPSAQARPATTRAEGSGNAFGMLEKEKRDKKDKREKKEEPTWRRADEVRRADTAPSLPSASGRAEWKPRALGKSEASRPGPELGRTVSSASGGTGRAAGDEEPSEKECVDDVMGTFKELVASHDLDEAVERVQALKIPQRYHQAVVSNMFAGISEQGDTARPHLLSLVLRLVGAAEPRKEILQRASLAEGLMQFIEERYADLKCDVPKLPKILREELFPALGKDALSKIEIAALISKMEGVDDLEDAPTP